MKKLLSAFLIGLIITLSSAGLIALAVDTSQATYTATIRITNNSTATTNVAVPFTADTDVYIDGGYMNSSANNTAVLSSSGADVAYMPARSGNTTWSVFVPSIGANTIKSDTLYMGGAADMGGFIRYFTGVGGMTVPDNASIELGNDFIISITGWFDNTVSGSLVDKGQAFSSIGDGSANITARTGGGQEILTGYTEVDGSGRLTVTASNVTATQLDRDETAYLYQDFGAAYFDALDIDLTIQSATGSVNGAFGGFSLANLVGNMAAYGTTEVSLYIQPAGGVPVIALARGKLTAADGYNGVYDTPYYVTVNRTAGNNVVTALIYSDSARTVLLDTLSVAGYGATTYRYAYGFQSYTAAAPATDFWGYVADITGVTKTENLVSASGVSSGLHKIDVTANVTHIEILIDDVSQASNTLAAGIVDTGTDWTFINNTIMPYMESANITVGGVLAGSWVWENAATFTDGSVNDNTATPTFRTISSDPDVSAVLVDFAPVSEAKAPAFAIDIPTTGWITENITTTGDYTSNVTASTYPGSAVITDIATAGETPVSVLTLILGCGVILAFSLFISWIMKANQERSLMIKLITVTAGVGIMIAVAAFDQWLLYMFLMIGIAIVMASSSRTFSGTGSTGNNMIGFLSMSFVGMTMINRILEGRFLQTTDIAIVREVVAFQPFNVFGLFTIPVPNVSFLTNGIPALMRWDYSFFGGNSQIIQYLLYSVTAVVSFMLFVLVFGAIYQMFSRGR